jgi:hypothetical protein
MTGHCNLRKHLHTMGIFNKNPVCKLCKEEEETTFHIVFECEVLARQRFRLLGLNNEPMAAVLGMNKTNFHVIKLQKKITLTFMH